jgi:YVTN family beta-propeller protein
MTINDYTRPSSRPHWTARASALLAVTGLALLLSVPGVQAGGKQIAASGVVFTADENGNTISRVDLSSGKVTTIPVAITPHNVQLSADGKKLFAVGIMAVKNVHGHGHDGEQGALLVFDTQRFDTAKPDEIEVGEHPAHVVADPAGKYALVTNSEDNDVRMVDLTGDSEQVTIPTGEFPHGLRISPDGREAYVANVKDGTVSVLDLAGAKEIARIRVGEAPVQVGFTPDGGQVFVSLRDEDKVAVIDTATRKVLGRIAVGDGPIQVHATPDGRFVLVANQGSQARPGDTVSVVDVAKRAVVKTIRTAPGAHGLSVDTEGRLAFVTNIYANSLSVIDISSLEVLATIDVGKGPNGVTYSQ